MPENRVLVVGATADYIELIDRRSTNRALFLTDAAERRQAVQPTPPPSSEILCELSAPANTILRAVTDHLTRFRQTAAAIVCFDCESMALAARLAAELGLPYPSVEAVETCRDKFASKERWKTSGILCPRAEIIDSPDRAVEFFRSIGGAVVIKPLSGSGSELVFRCDSEDDCRRAFATVLQHLEHHPNRRMFAPTGEHWTHIDTRRSCAIEEFVAGAEYSCDFIVDGTRTEIVRIAEKIPAPDAPFGTTLAYVVPATLPAGIEPTELQRLLGDAARALGVTRAICMVDFMMTDRGVSLIELSPRPGGDCLPPLIRESSGLDMISLALDFAERKPTAVPPPTSWACLVGLRIFAEKAGVLLGLDLSRLTVDRRLRLSYFIRSAGHAIVLPPDDYASWYLGFVLFRPADGVSVASQCAEIRSFVGVNLQTPMPVQPSNG